MMRTGILALARPTFDVGEAERTLAEMIKALERKRIEPLGSCRLLMDSESALREQEMIASMRPDAWAVLQTTFTDASVVAELAKRSQLPIMIWAVPEPRAGGRLRLNSLCGLNLAAHALGLRQRKFTWIHCDPENADPDRLDALLKGQNAYPSSAQASEPAVSDSDLALGRRVAESLHGARIGQIGSPPAGFDTCNCDPAELQGIFGVELVQLSLASLFTAAETLDLGAATGAGAPQLRGLKGLDQKALDRSVRLSPALKQLAASGNFDAFAVRCWPECFTEYGGALCGPVSMLADEMVPCACESDVYGAVSQLIAQRAARMPVFLADLVDADVEDDTAVVWHCGQAPISMRDPQFPAEAVEHSNRLMPLLCQFPLKPGKVTLSRISKAHGKHKLVIAEAEMLRRPLAFSGTAGVLRFSRPVSDVLQDIIEAGLEHHYAVSYGDLRHALRGTAAVLGLKVLEI